MNLRPDIAGQAYKGRTASIGFAHGPFVRVDAAPTDGRAVGTPPDEERELRAALASAGRQVAALAEAAGGEAAQILEFQVALLEDEEFLEPTFAAIRGGTPADAAWVSSLAEQIAGYNSAADEYRLRAQLHHQRRIRRSRDSARREIRHRQFSIRRHPLH